ncbi:DsbA family protein [Enterobacter kobei]|uniref:DsbA family protein n=1 Tax=Enterobacter kobei TaxID=208224 RepID=UPI002A7EDE2C|nr:DsbA family protein [Enterobacter kobei]
MGELGDELTKAWSVAKLLGVESLVEIPLFAAVQEKRSIKSEAYIRQVFIDSGVPGKQYDAAIHSLVVKSMIIQKKQAVADYNVLGTPSFYIKGKYLVRNAGIGPSTVDEYAKSFANVIGELLREKDK